MVVVPGIIPVTRPDVFTVATLVAVLLHVPPVTTSVKFIVAEGQTVDRPVIAPAFGAGSTVMIAVAATVPQLLVTV